MIRSRSVTAVGVLLIYLVPAPIVCASDLVDVANEVRSEGCGKRSIEGAPLRAQQRLDAAARELADGHVLTAATQSAGYRASTSASIHLRNAADEEDVARILAKRYCRIVADPSLRDIGVVRRGDDVWMVLASPFLPPSPDEASVTGQRVLALINEARSRARRCGRKKFPATLELNTATALEQAALAHANDMAMHGFMAHEGSDGSMAADRVTRAGYAWAAVAENVAAGQASAEDVVETWLDSPVHCANLMNARYSETGVAYALDPDDEKGIYWVQVFASPRAASAD